MASLLSLNEEYQLTYLAPRQRASLFLLWPSIPCICALLLPCVFVTGGYGSDRGGFGGSGAPAAGGFSSGGGGDRGGFGGPPGGGYGR